MTEQENFLLNQLVNLHFKLSPDPDNEPSEVPFDYLATEITFPLDQIRTTLESLISHIPDTLCLKGTSRAILTFTPGHIPIHLQDALIFDKTCELLSANSENTFIPKPILIAHLVKANLGTPQKIEERLQVLSRMGYLAELD